MIWQVIFGAMIKFSVVPGFRAGMTRIPEMQKCPPYLNTNLPNSRLIQ